METMKTCFYFDIPEGSIVKTPGVPATAESPEIPSRSYPARKYLIDLVRKDLNAHVQPPKKDFNDFRVTTKTVIQESRMSLAADSMFSQFYKGKKKHRASSA